MLKGAACNSYIREVNSVKGSHELLFRCCCAPRAEDLLLREIKSILLEGLASPLIGTL
jgi:hypothetical protein